MKSNTEKEVQNKNVLNFKGKEYYLDRVQAVGRAGLEVCVRLSDISPDLTDVNSVFSDNPQYDGPISFYQYEGKYHILLGMNKALAILKMANDESPDGAVLTMPGNLITKHALKRTEILPLHMRANIAVETRQFSYNRNNTPRQPDHRTKQERW